MWRFGNLLQFVIGKGLNPIGQIIQSDDFSQNVIDSLGPLDCGAYYTYRLMNLKKIYPYISPGLNEMLMRFSASSLRHYNQLWELMEVLREVITTLPKDPLEQPLA